MAAVWKRTVVSSAFAAAGWPNCAALGRTESIVATHDMWSERRVSRLRNASDLTPVQQHYYCILDSSLDFGVGREGCDMAMIDVRLMQTDAPSNLKLFSAVENMFWVRRAIFISGGPLPAKVWILWIVTLIQKLRECVLPRSIIVLNRKYKRLNVYNAKVISLQVFWPFSDFSLLTPHPVNIQLPTLFYIECSSLQLCRH